MSGFWITECIPLYITSLIPLIYLPAVQILPTIEVSKNYFKDTIIMFMAGIMMALLIEQSGLHMRIALMTLRIVGSSPRRIHLGMMIVCGFLSMWVSNSAATAMMCPILKGIFEELRSQGLEIYEKSDEVEQGKKKDEDKRPSKLVMGIYVSIAFSSSIGGSATIIGSPTNLVLKGQYDEKFQQYNPTEKIDFMTYMFYAFIPSWLILFLTYFFMELVYMGLWNKKSEVNKQITLVNENKSISKIKIKEKYNDLGPTTVHEASVIVLFIILIILFFLKSPNGFTGWGDLFHVKVKNAVPASLIVALSFLLPTSYAFLRYCCGSKPLPEKPASSLSSWKYLQDNMPWGLIFLVGGGFALAAGSTKSGLDKTLSDRLNGLKSLEHPLILFICLVVALVATSFTANVAVANVILPILAEISIAVKAHPLYLMFPVGIACSMAFHLPVSTPPNAIVCSFANIKTKDLVSILSRT